MSEEPKRRRLRQKRSSTREKLRKQARLEKMIWISAVGAIGLAILIVTIRYYILSIN
jgi:cell division protein FtsL